MITKDEAIAADEFHRGDCRRKVGPRGGVTITMEVWRRNGQTQTWKRSPDEFRIPVKRGFRKYGQIYHFDAPVFHTNATCPLNQPCENCGPPTHVAGYHTEAI